MTRRRRTNPTPKLIEYYDLREFDFDTGKPIPLQRGTGATCERCRREHAKVYVVQTVEGSTKSVGSGCCARAFEGWEPSKDEIKAAKKEFRSKREEARKARLEELAAPLVAALMKLRIPAWEKLGVTPGGMTVYGDRASGAQVWTEKGDLDREYDRAERWGAYATSWIAIQASKLPLDTVPRGFTEREVRYLAERTAIAKRWDDPDRYGMKP